MARKARVFGNTGFYHVILRGNNKQNLFNDDSDRKFFIARLRRYSMELKITVHAYCLMNNHVHILVGDASENISLLVQKITNSYVFYFNRKYDRCGHLFQGRFKSEPISDEVHFKTVYRYILQNTEKAGFAKLDQYKWNSFWALKKCCGNSFVNVDYIRNMFSSDEMMMEFIFQRELTKCMEYENRFVLSDDRAIGLIKKLFRISSPYKLERLELEDQILKCKIMKKHGLSMSQIGRITGISRLIIRKS